MSALGRGVRNPFRNRFRTAVVVVLLALVIGCLGARSLGHSRTARATLGSISAATVYGSLLLFAIGGVLVVFIMVLSTRERIREIGTLKAIGASSAEVVSSFWPRFLR